jgi:hypothetical protein
MQRSILGDDSLLGFHALYSIWYSVGCSRIATQCSILRDGSLVGSFTVLLCLVHPITQRNVVIKRNALSCDDELQNHRHFQMLRASGRDSCYATRRIENVLYCPRPFRVEDQSPVLPGFETTRNNCHRSLSVTSLLSR